MAVRKTTDLFLINGTPLLAPDEEVGFHYEDLDAADAGRDESGFMHRIMVRSKVGSWSFSYHHLTEAEKNYMEGLFGDAATFSFTRPSRLDASKREVSTCYRSKYSLAWKNARTGLWSGYSFHIIEC